MAHYIGNVQGTGKFVERLGSKKSGMSAMVGTWSTKVHLRLWQDAHGNDFIRIYVEGDNGVAMNVCWCPLSELAAFGRDPDAFVKNYMRRQLTGKDDG